MVVAVGHCPAVPAGWAAVDLCWQRKGLDTWLSGSCFYPSKELQSTELRIPHSCNSVELLQISSLWEILLIAPLWVHKLLSCL